MSPIIKTLLAVSVVIILSTILYRTYILITLSPLYESPDNSPLNTNGFNFPYKTISNTDATITNMAIDSRQTLFFKGEAVHNNESY